MFREHAFLQPFITISLLAAFLAKITTTKMIKKKLGNYSQSHKISMHRDI
jgi:hypothetical protein